jgi:phosphoserine aminotransferase
MKPHNFSAGPSILPQEVFDQAAAAIQNFAGTGLSVLEVSHRGKEFVAVMDKAIDLVKELLHLPDDYHVMFLSGGASTQFFMTAMNFMDESSKSYYLDTGAWSKKAIKEAKEFGQLEVLASSSDKNYTYIPTPSVIPSDGRYLHITSNNTIFGTQFQNWPNTSMPIVCDASSDIFSRPMPISKFGCIYAGAQKNMGPAGTTLVVVREDMLGKVNRKIPTMLNYRTHINKGSMFNTPPVFPIYVSMLTMEWVKKQGGVEAVEAKNIEKAKVIYDAIDASSIFAGTTAKEDRSLMNVTFVAQNEALTTAFLQLCKEENISGLAGHRDVGGFRASIYNAMPLSSVKHLVDVMQEFERKA